MKGRAAAAVLMTTLVGVGVVKAQTPEKAWTVFVTAAPVQKADKGSQKEHEIAFAEAENKRKDLEKTLKTQHGNKRENWPTEAQALYRDAADVAMIANMHRLYQKLDQDQVIDSVEDAKKGFTGAGMRSKQENVVLVETANDAQLIVELKGRRSAAGSGGLFGRHYFVLFAIRAGPKLSTEQVAAIARSNRHGALVLGPEEGAREWMFEALGGGSWKVAGTQVSSIVGRFISANQDVLTKAAGR